MDKIENSIVMRYDSNVRIGNWNEDLFLKQVGTLIII